MAEMKRRVEGFQVSLSIAYDSWWNDTPFAVLSEEEASTGKARPEQLSLFRKKGVAVRHKWEMLSVAAAELNALCDHVVTRYNPAVPLPLSSYLTLKIESFLTIARSLLDVLSTCLAIHQVADSRVQSFNALRKRGDCPEWLKQYAQAELVRSNDTSPSKTGWLSFLMSEKEGDQSLRDFVVHRGVASYAFRELPFEEGWDLVFQPRPIDNYVLPIKGVVENVLNGVNALAVLIEQELGPLPD